MDFTTDITAFQASHPFVHEKVDGVEFRYILCGDGDKTITLLTGGMGIAELNFSFIQQLESSYRVLAFDYPMGKDTNNELVDSVYAFLKSLKIRKTILVGESYGGYLAQMIARKYPDIVEGMCLFSTAGLNGKTIDSLKKKYSGIARPALWALGHVPYNWLKPLLVKVSLKKVKDVTEEEYRYMEDFFIWAFKDYTGQFDVHMTSLLIDIMNQKPCRKEEFDFLKGRVMLALPGDDESFTLEMQKDLIFLFDEPYVVEHVTGGHLAPILQTTAYVKEIRSFVEERL
ncbi:MAG: alpha/beta hydrolase [Oscillospiraceae bacterium]|nr:alpha/beta hydrolase [Oscillospiraceae bacterium]